MIIINCEVEPSDIFQDTAFKACLLAKQLDNPIKFTFNGIDIIVKPTDSFLDVVGKYDITRKSEKNEKFIERYGQHG